MYGISITLLSAQSLHHKTLKPRSLKMPTPLVPFANNKYYGSKQSVYRTRNKNRRHARVINKAYYWIYQITQPIVKMSKNGPYPSTHICCAKFYTMKSICHWTSYADG